jgi:hypothetical protein
LQVVAVVESIPSMQDVQRVQEGWVVVAQAA